VKRRLCVAILAAVSAFAAVQALKYWRARHWRRAFDELGATGLEQLCAAIASGGNESPLDAVQVIADLQSFLNEGATSD
jgi:hypothetical protein